MFDNMYECSGRVTWRCRQQNTDLKIVQSRCNRVSYKQTNVREMQNAKANLQEHRLLKVKFILWTKSSNYCRNANGLIQISEANLKVGTTLQWKVTNRFTIIFPNYSPIMLPSIVLIFTAANDLNVISKMRIQMLSLIFHQFWLIIF